MNSPKNQRGSFEDEFVDQRPFLGERHNHRPPPPFSNNFNQRPNNNNAFGNSNNNFRNNNNPRNSSFRNNNGTSHNNNCRNSNNNSNNTNFRNNNNDNFKKKNNNFGAKRKLSDNTSPTDASTKQFIVSKDELKSLSARVAYREEQKMKKMKQEEYERMKEESDALFISPEDVNDLKQEILGRVNDMRHLYEVCDRFCNTRVMRKFSINDTTKVNKLLIKVIKTAEDWLNIKHGKTTEEKPETVASLKSGIPIYFRGEKEIIIDPSTYESIDAKALTLEQFCLRAYEKVMQNTWPQPKSALFCRICNYSEFANQEMFDRHKKSARHLEYERQYEAGFCVDCQVHCGDEANFAKHKQTKKHMENAYLLECAKNQATRYYLKCANPSSTQAEQSLEHNRPYSNNPNSNYPPSAKPLGYEKPLDPLPPLREDDRLYDNRPPAKRPYNGACRPPGPNRAFEKENSEGRNNDFRNSQGRPNNDFHNSQGPWADRHQESTEAIGQWKSNREAFQDNRASHQRPYDDRSREPRAPSSDSRSSNNSVYQGNKPNWSRNEDTYKNDSRNNPGNGERPPLENDSSRYSDSNITGSDTSTPLNNTRDRNYGLKNPSNSKASSLREQPFTSIGARDQFLKENSQKNWREFPPTSKAPKSSKDVNKTRANDTDELDMKITASSSTNDSKPPSSPVVIEISEQRKANKEIDQVVVIRTPSPPPVKNLHEYFSEIHKSNQKSAKGAKEMVKASPIDLTKDDQEENEAKKDSEQPEDEDGGLDEFIVPLTGFMCTVCHETLEDQAEALNHYTSAEHKQKVKLHKIEYGLK